MPTQRALRLMGRPSDRLEPFQFGEQYRKRTWLWLRGLPPLMKTLIHTSPKPYVNLTKRKGDPGIAVTPHERSRFWPGVAAAMADQWGSLD